MSDSGGLARLVPGFDFLQNLAKSAGAAIPGVGGFGQWVAPTFDPAEIEKRIDELKTVQFWLEQNARMLAATIQALEVQKMTLSTFKTMNVQLGDMKSMLPGGQAGSDRAAPVAPTPTAATRKPPPARSASPAKPQSAPASVVDPMQWWNALTSQFTQLATEAIKDGATDAAKNLAGSVLRSSAEGAAASLKKAAAMPVRVAGAVGAAAVGAASQVLAPKQKPAAKRPRARRRDGSPR